MFELYREFNFIWYFQTRPNNKFWYMQKTGFVHYRPKIPNRSHSFLHLRRLSLNHLPAAGKVAMLFVARRLGSAMPSLQNSASLLRFVRTEAGQPRRRNKSSSLPLKKKEEKSEWWIVDGEMHEIGDHVPLRERFTIPRDNIPNRRRKQLREQFMRRTRLVLKESVSLKQFLSQF